MSNIILRPPPNALNALPDTDRYKMRFDIGSGSTDAVYRVAYDAAPGAMYWTCSCRGNIGHGDCKHLIAMGLHGRKYGKNLDQARTLGLLGAPKQAEEKPKKRKALSHA